MTRMELTANLTDKNRHACENRKWYQFQLSSAQPVSDFEMHSTFEEPLSPDKELSTLWFIGIEYLVLYTVLAKVGYLN